MCPYPEPETFLADFSHLRLGVPLNYFMYVSPTKPRLQPSSHPIPVTCRTHLVRLVFVNTDNIWCNVLCPRVWCYSNIMRGEKRDLFPGHWWHRCRQWVVIPNTSGYGLGEMLWFTCTNKTRATIIFAVDCMYLGILNFVCMQIMNRLMNRLLNIIGKSEIKKNCDRLKLKFQI